MFKTYIIIAVVGSMVATVGLLYYRDTQKRISTLQQNNAKLEVAVQSKEVALKEMTSSFEKQQKLNKEPKSEEMPSGRTRRRRSAIS